MKYSWRTYTGTSEKLQEQKGVGVESANPGKLGQKMGLFTQTESTESRNKDPKVPTRQSSNWQHRCIFKC